MDISKKISGGTLEITLSGPFTFGDHPAFREILDTIEAPETRHTVFHMAGVTFIDSAALGMLLLALDASTKHDKGLTISGATGQVKKMFDMSRFNSMFTMH